MKSLRYSIQIDGNTVYSDLNRKEATEIAKREAEQDKHVLVTWFRKSDGQLGYLNRDGNHDITGKAW